MTSLNHRHRDSPTGQSIDLTFSSLDERDRQYNARDSVTDFEYCVGQYAELSAIARRSCLCIPDLQYGLEKSERLDIFPVNPSLAKAPALIFIHGGYWRSQTKENAALMAKVYTHAGVAVVTLEYPLLPRVTLAETVRSVRGAVAWLYKNAATYGIDPHRIFASGSSAGGHLMGMLLAPGWQADYGLPEDVIRGGVGLSGLYDIRPLCETHVNEWLRLYPDQAERLSPYFQLPNLPLPLVLAVGGLETDGFRNQTDVYERAWRFKGYPVTRVQAGDRNHFNLLCDMADAKSALNQATLSMIFNCSR